MKKKQVSKQKCKICQRKLPVDKLSEDSWCKECTDEYNRIKRIKKQKDDRWIIKMVKSIRRNEVKYDKKMEKEMKRGGRKNRSISDKKVSYYGSGIDYL